MRNIQKTYRTRFPDESRPSRTALWNVLTKRVFGDYIGKSDTVMDLGAGYCEFINTVKSRKKIAVDANPDVRRYAAKGVSALVCDITSIPAHYDGTADVVFISNVLEHLPTKHIVLAVLSRTFALLKKGGRLIIMQPNIDLTGTAYWDFIDHQVALNGRSVLEALAITGFTTERYVERFLPYTTKGMLPSWPWIVSVYLSVPPVLRLFAGQSLFIARKP